LKEESYQIIIAGAGAAGLSLAMHLIEAGINKDKRILLIDKSSKRGNDRTWCFWETGKGAFEECVIQQWDNVSFLAPQFSKKLNLLPYRYKMIRGIDFYRYCLNKISKAENITIINETIQEIKESGVVVTESNKYSGEIIFNSAISLSKKDNKYHQLLQHFKGWYIETEEEIFDHTTATLMDFTIEQKNECRFMYELPVSKSKALIEFTLFSENLLKEEEYEKEIGDYIEKKHPGLTYTISEKEFGIIPMTDQPFPSYNGTKIINIGTIGGATKASTGYTFQFIQKQCKLIVDCISKNNSFEKLNKLKPSRFHFYDRVFLRVLRERKEPAYKIFTDLFKNLPDALPFKFLAEETEIQEEIRVLSAFNKSLFSSAAIRQEITKKEIKPAQ
jgi:lycopene beta-cyclase